MTEPVARRVAVTGPRTAAVRRPPARPVSSLDEQDVVADLLLRSLVRAQLGLALRLAALFGAGFGGLPLLFALDPTLGHVRVLGVLLPWLLLGAVPYPLLVLGGLLYTRLAARNEQDFLDLVDRT